MQPHYECDVPPFGQPMSDDSDVKAPLADFVSAAQSTDGLWSSGFAATPTLKESNSQPKVDGAPTSSLPMRHKQPMPNNTTAVNWGCVRCTFRNEKHINFCEICNTKNPLKQVQSDECYPLATQSALPQGESLSPRSHAGNSKSSRAVYERPVPLQQQQQPTLFSIMPTTMMSTFTVENPPVPTQCVPTQQHQVSPAASFAWPSMTQFFPSGWQSTALFGQPAAGEFVESPQSPIFQRRSARKQIQKRNSKKEGKSSSPPPPPPISYLKCSICLLGVDANLFTGSQIKKRASQRKCPTCIQNMENKARANMRLKTQESTSTEDDSCAAQPTSTKSSDTAVGSSQSCRSGGVRIEDLEFLYQIGVGGYGKVMAARHKTLDRHYAVKILNFRKEESDEESESSSDVTSSSKSDPVDAGCESVEQDGEEWTTLGVARENTKEEDILASVSHPFVSSLLGCFREEKRKLLVFELATGDLYYKLTASPSGVFSRELTAFYAAQLLLAIEHLHGKGIIHKDIKLDNILLGPDGYISLSDFGSATRVTAADKYTMASKDCFIGTVMFSAPELVRESFFHYADYCDSALITNLSRESLKGDQPCSFQVDYWSFGTAVFEMLTGKSPFDHVDEDEDGREHTQKEATSSSSSGQEERASSGVPQDAADFIKQGKDVLDCRYTCPESMDDEARDFVQSLLERNPTKRLGANGADEVKRHPFFKDIDWQMLVDKRCEPHMFSSA